jgi:hypothetical protein
LPGQVAWEYIVDVRRHPENRWQSPDTRVAAGLA